MGELALKRRVFPACHRAEWNQQRDRTRHHPRSGHQSGNGQPAKRPCQCQIRPRRRHAGAKSASRRNPRVNWRYGATWPTWRVSVRRSGAAATTGDALEAIFKATGKDLVGDAYTRLYTPSKLTETNATLFDALNRIGDTMRERWTKANGWLTFRSASLVLRPSERGSRAANWRDGPRPAKNMARLRLTT